MTPSAEARASSAPDKRLIGWPQAFAAALVGLGVLIAQGIIPLPFGRRA